MTINTEALDQMLASRSTTIARDLKLNLKRILEEGALDPREGVLSLLACATSVEHSQLVAHAREQAAAQGISAEEIQEAAESAAIMAMLNVYYRSKHFIGKEDEYRSAGLRMTALAKPAMGKATFEMLAFAVSCINGCEVCVRSHESALRQHEVSTDKIHDLIRMAGVVKGLKSLATAA